MKTNLESPEEEELTTTQLAMYDLYELLHSMAQSKKRESDILYEHADKLKEILEAEGVL